MNLHPGYVVAIVGGAVAGSEAAAQLSQRGIYCVVFDQNALPYGKIEDGLPKWHEKLRDQEEAKIDEKMQHPYVKFVPNMRLGQNLNFNDLTHKWGFSAVLLAVGAWRDRPLAIDGVDAYVGKGLYYQNPLVYWFNHYHEPTYNGQTFDLCDDVAIVGGGLASIDVAKLVMIETVQKALRTRGHDVDMFLLERKGVTKVLVDLGLSLEKLGLKGCTLYYRRRAEDMPLVPMPPNPTAEDEERAKPIRQKILKKFQDKYGVKFVGCHAPFEKIVEGDRLTGLVFQQSEIVNGKLKLIAGSRLEVRAPLFISSIGSIPEPLEGVPGEGERFKIANWETGQLDGFDHVFALGNAVTGKGNIKESLTHGRQVAIHVANSYLDWPEEFYRSYHAGVEMKADAQVESIFEAIKTQKMLNITGVREIMAQVEQVQQSVGYAGSYVDWANRYRPIRLEALLAKTGAHG